MVTIIPKFSTKRPFKFLNHAKIDALLPSIPVKVLYLYIFQTQKQEKQQQKQKQVPLWMAMHLKRKLKCQIQTPSWMDPDRLASVLEEEKRENSFSSDIPEHYAEISSMLLEVASGDDISNENAQRMRLLLEDIRNTRQAKIRQGIKQVMNNAKNGSPPHVIKITNVGSLEIESMREVLLKGIEEVHKFKIQRGSSSRRNTPAPRQRSRKSTWCSRMLEINISHFSTHLVVVVKTNSTQYKTTRTQVRTEPVQVRVEPKSHQHPRLAVAVVLGEVPKESERFGDSDNLSMLCRLNKLNIYNFFFSERRKGYFRLRAARFLRL